MDTNKIQEVTPPVSSLYNCIYYTAKKFGLKATHIVAFFEALEAADIPPDKVKDEFRRRQHKHTKKEHYQFIDFMKEILVSTPHPIE